MSSFLLAALELSNPKLLDQVQQFIRLRHYSLRTEEAYVGWPRRCGFPGGYLRCDDDYSRALATPFESAALA
jgi:hypothetical protein